MTVRPPEGVPAAGSLRRWWPRGREGARPDAAARNAAAPDAAAPDAAEVYRGLAPAVLGYVRSQGAAEPEDVLGEIFLQVVRDLPRFRGDDAALRRWVFTIAHHRLVDARRRSGRRPILGGRTVPEFCAPPPADPLDPDLVRALGELTADQREVVALRFVADLPIDVVAALTGRTPGAVKALQHRALATLAEHLGDAGDAAMSAASG